MGLSLHAFNELIIKKTVLSGQQTASLLSFVNQEEALHQFYETNLHVLIGRL